MKPVFTYILVYYCLNTVGICLLNSLCIPFPFYTAHLPSGGLYISDP